MDVSTYRLDGFDRCFDCSLKESFAVVRVLQLVDIGVILDGMEFAADVTARLAVTCEHNVELADCLDGPVDLAEDVLNLVDHRQDQLIERLSLLLAARQFFIACM